MEVAVFDDRKTGGDIVIAKNDGSRTVEHVD